MAQSARCHFSVRNEPVGNVLQPKFDAEWVNGYRMGTSDSYFQFQDEVFGLSMEMNINTPPSTLSSDNSNQTYTQTTDCLFSCLLHLSLLFQLSHPPFVFPCPSLFFRHDEVLFTRLYLLVRWAARSRGPKTRAKRGINWTARRAPTAWRIPQS